MKSLAAFFLILSITAAIAEATPESIITLNIEPSAAHPRHSEGFFAALKSGRILFCCSQ